jgi:predicted small metal-binding protein
LPSIVQTLSKAIPRLGIYIQFAIWLDYKRVQERSEARERRYTAEKVIQCPCETVLRDEDELVSKAQQHAKELHGMELTREQALAMAKPA